MSTAPVQTTSHLRSAWQAKPLACVPLVNTLPTSGRSLEPTNFPKVVKVSSSRQWSNTATVVNAVSAISMSTRRSCRNMKINQTASMLISITSTGTILSTFQSQFSTATSVVLTMRLEKSWWNIYQVTIAAPNLWRSVSTRSSFVSL